jgi:exosortase A
MKTETHFVPELATGLRKDHLVAGLAAAAVVFGLLAAFWPTAVSIEAIWRRTETFAHGYVVVAIVLWLVWRRRTVLATMPARPFWPALAAVAAAGFAWLLGSLAGILGLEQFGLYFMLVGAVVAVLGFPLSREIAFPLAFLAFAVPFGEFMVPWLIDRTADFTIAALRASGIPVFREGNHFTIPSGRWSVVEACSGVRYLIASLMVGTLYAHLSYRSARKRLIFVLAAIAVPIIANWLRAYLIVMLGHLTNNRLAVGVDHIIYGWIFFGVVMVIMFWGGSFWREDKAPAVARPIRFGGGFAGFAPPRAGAVAAAVVLALTLGIVWRPLGATLDARAQTIAGKLPAITASAGWRPAPELRPVWRPNYIGARSELHQWFTKDGQVVGLYVALYSQQTQGSELIASRNGLVSPASNAWVRLGEGRARIQWRSEAISVRTADIAGSGVHLSAWAWYWVNERHTASDTLAKALLALAKVSLRPDYSAVIVLYTPQPDARTRDQRALDAFAREMGGSVMEALVQAVSK